MDGNSWAAAIQLGVLLVGYLALFWQVFRRAAIRTPSGIVKRLSRTGRSVTSPSGSYRAWDPGASGLGYFCDRGSAVYTLDEDQVVHVRFTTKTGEVVERSGPIPSYMHPDTPTTIRRRWIARAVIALYLAVAIATFSVTASAVGGSGSYRARTAGLVALAALSATWLLTHLVLVLRANRHGPTRASAVHWARRVSEWSLGYVVISAVLGVAWRLQGSSGEPGPSWGASFLEGGIFVLVCAATIAASTHHHNFIHHTPDAPTKEES